MRKSEAEHLRDRLAAEGGVHRPPGRPAKASYNPLGASSSLQAGVLAREYQNALACHLDAARAKVLSDTRLAKAKRRLDGARKALVAAGIEPDTLQAPGNIAENLE